MGLRRLFHPKLDIPAEIMLLILEAAANTARAGYQRYRQSRRLRRGGTLRPGSATPLWNELRKLVRRRIVKYGDKAVLGRELGLPRQRVHEFLKAGAAMPDAERTLELLGWLARRSHLRWQARRLARRRRG